MDGSTLGYPFASRGPSSGSLLSSVVAVTTHTLTRPWHLFLRWISWCAAIVLSTLSVLGAPPLGFIPAEKLRELNSIVDHMHAREDLYRRAIRELQDDLDTKDSDRKRALRKLKATKEEISQLTGRMTVLQQEFQSNATSRDSAGAGAHRSKAATGTHLLVHGTVGLAIASVWWFAQSEHAALQWKLIFSMFFPLLWIYVSWTISDHSLKSHPLVLLCACWFLIGLIVAQAFSHHAPYAVNEH